MPLDIPSSITPRPYQHASLHAALESLKEFRSTLIVLPTGTGKTIVFSLLARLGHDRGRRILILVDRDELVKQAVRRLRQDVGIHAQVEKARLRADPDARVVVASVQTLGKPKRLAYFEKDAFDLVIGDEAHHGVSPGWRRIFDYFETAKVVGVTATPDRLDKQKLSEVFEDTAYEMSVREAVLEGWLVPIRPLRARVPGLDLSGVRKAARDLNRGDVEAVVKNADILEAMTDGAIRYVGERQTIVFCVSIAHAKAVVEFLKKHRKSAELVTGDTKETPPQKRAAFIEAFRQGNIQFLCNVDVLREGFDAPPTSAIVMMRPTTSLVVYCQQVGRGTRPLPGVIDGLHTAEERRAAIAQSDKPDVLVLDFVGNSGRHALVRAVEAVDPDADPEVLEKAERLMEERQLDLIEAIDMAKELVEEARRRPVKDGQGMLEWQVEEVDPFDETAPGRTLKLFALDWKRDPWKREVTAKQIATLERFGVKDAHLLNRKTASALLEQLFVRSDRNLARPTQVEALVRSGMERAEALQLSFEAAKDALDHRPVTDAQAKLLRRFGYTSDQLEAMNSGEASLAIDAIQQNGWRRPTGATP